MRSMILHRALVLALTAIMIATTATFAAVTTDQEDYSPGSVVTISGDSLSGATYVEGNTVDVAITGPVSAAYPDGWPASCVATVTAAGDWSCQFTLDADPAVAVGDYTYTATQKDPSGAVVSTETGTFTDAATFVLNLPSATGSPGLVWYRGDFDLAVSGTFRCDGTGGGSGFIACTNSSVTATIHASNGGAGVGAVLNLTTGGNVTKSLTTGTGGANTAWSLAFPFRASAGSGQWGPLPANGKYDVRATIDFTGPSDPPAEVKDDAFGIDNLAPELPNITVNASTLGNVTIQGTGAVDVHSGLKGTKIKLYVYDVDTDASVNATAIESGGINGVVGNINYGKWNASFDATDTPDTGLDLDPGDYCVFGVAEDNADNGNSSNSGNTTWFPDDPEVDAENNDYDGTHCFTVVDDADTDAPTVTISYPEDGETYLPSEYIALCSDSDSNICGTADDGSGSGVALVEVDVMWENDADDRWFDGTDFDATAAGEWPDATGTTSWELPFNPYLALQASGIFGATDDATIWEGFESEDFEAQARATDVADNVGYSDADGVAEGNQAHAFTIAKGVTSVLYTGLSYDIDNNGELALSATVSSDEASCDYPRTVHFWVDGTEVGSGFATDSNGDAATTTNVGPGIYEIEVTVDENLDCTPASFTTVVSVVSPGDAANGGGWYHNNYGDGSPRINFGFTVRQDCGSTANPCSNYTAETMPYKGQFLAINNGQWRLKGTLNYFGNTACPLITDWSGVCGSVRGAGNLFSWDQSLNGGLGDWVLEDEVTFTVGFYDGGSSKKGGAKPDYAGILTITGYSGSADLPLSMPLQLKGGNVTLSDGPAPTTGGRKIR